jgi:hypothetical protein
MRLSALALAGVLAFASTNALARSGSVPHAPSYTQVDLWSAPANRGGGPGHTRPYQGSSCQVCNGQQESRLRCLVAVPAVALAMADCRISQPVVSDL